MASCLSCLYCARIQYFRRKPILYCALRGHILKSTAPQTLLHIPLPHKNTRQMTTAQRITQLSGISPSECGCEKCKQMCRTPCLGTPEDIERLAIAGYADRLCLSLWCVGKMAGLTDKPLTIVAPRQEPDGWCTFRLPDGRCELHDKGLKPLEGKLATCRPRPADWTIDKDITWLVAKEWLPLQDQINRITNR